MTLGQVTISKLNKEAAPWSVGDTLNKAQDTVGGVAKGLATIPVEIVKSLGEFAAQKTLPLLLAAPFFLGLMAGGVSSKLTSPSADIKSTQNSLIAGQFDAASSELQRQRALAKMKEKNTNVNNQERSLHV
jgi:hypothetical protein